MNSRLLQALRAYRPESNVMIAQKAYGLTRRRFIQTTGGVVVAGAAIGHQLLRPQILSAQGDEPLPIPGGSPLLSPFHIYGPTPDGSFDPIDAEPSTITNFNGVVGLAYVNGMVTRTHVPSGATEEFPFLFSDMRFMQGVYRGVDGKPRQGTFALI